jgi:LacI family transcriptional regulator
MKKKITINDLARHLKISKTAISFVLNGKGKEKGISESSETRILDYVNKISYMPNISAQGLRTGKTKTIGMMVEDISDPFFSSIARVMEEIAYIKGYKILYSSTENNTQKAKDLIQLYRNRQVEGYIIVPPPGIEEDINELIDDNMAVVLFDRTLTGIDIDNVLVDNYHSSYKAVKHLIENGYRNIAMITLDSEQVQMMERERGYREAVDEIGKAYLIKNIGFHDRNAGNVQEIQQFLNSGNEIDAVFFTTNYLAESGLEAIRNLKLRIPEDLGIVVFDDDKLFRLFSPSITAIAQPIVEISEHVIRLMLALLSGKGGAKKTRKSILLPALLQIRESSAPKPGISSVAHQGIYLKSS